MQMVQSGLNRDCRTYHMYEIKMVGCVGLGKSEITLTFGEIFGLFRFAPVVHSPTLFNNV